MSETLQVALIGLISSGLGAFLGVLTNSKLIAYKIDELQKQVEKHNKVIERTYDIEEKISVHDEKLKVMNHRIKDLEKKEEKR